MSARLFAPSDLIRFLLSRIDEDDAELRALRRRLTRSAVPIEDLPGVRSVERLRAECAARRAVVGRVQKLLLRADVGNQPVVHDSMLYMLQVMAEPYHEHYAYRPEWSLRRVEAVKSAAKQPTTPRAKQPVAQSADA